MDGDSSELAIVGCGTMGEAILVGLLGAGWLEPGRVTVTTRRAEVAGRLGEEHGVRALTDNLTACENADVVVVALKPQRIKEVVDTNSMRTVLAGKLVLSIAAGVRLEQLSAWLPGSQVMRAMPNTPCLIGEGMTVLSHKPGVSPEQRELAKRIFQAVGRVIELEDKHMDAVTSLGGSGPAFAYVMLESLADGGVMMGLPRDVALEIAAQVFQGAARMVLASGSHPAALKDQVTTPAGSTIAGLLTMEDGRIRSVLARSIQEATKVAAGLGEE